MSSPFYRFSIRLPLDQELEHEICYLLIESNIGFTYTVWRNLIPPNKFEITFGRFNEEGKIRMKKTMEGWSIFNFIVDGITIEKVL